MVVAARPIAWSEAIYATQPATIPAHFKKYLHNYF
jgi:hypothetical protein